STFVFPSANTLPDTGRQTGVTELSTRSVADVLKVTAAPRGPVASAVGFPGKVRSGAVVSTTETLKWPVVARPPLSVTEHCTVVSPSGNAEPDAGVHDGAGSGLSSASEAPTT